MKRLLSLIISSALLVLNSFAQPGANDPNFNTFDNGSWGAGTYGSSGTGDIYSLAVNSNNGKIYAGGDFNVFNGLPINYFICKNGDGSLDLNFNTGTGPNGIVRCVLVQPDGKIIIGGTFTQYNGANRNKVARINTDGSLDATFYPVVSPGNLYSMVLQPDGKVIIAGQNIVRLNSDGSTDTGFIQGAANNSIYTIALQSNGKIIAGGAFTTYSGANHKQLVCLNPDGTIDAGFSSGNGVTQVSPGGAAGIIYAVAIRFDGKIMIGGFFDFYDDQDSECIARLYSDGSFDSGIDFEWGPNNNVLALCYQPNGDLIVGGAFTSWGGHTNKYLTRLDENISFTYGYNTTILIQTATSFSNIRAVALQPDGKIIIAGEVTQLYRLDSNGNTENDFNRSSGANAAIHDIEVQQNGQIYIAGDFAFYNTIYCPGVARLYPNGNIDTTFLSGIPDETKIYKLAVQPDGKIIAGGINYGSDNNLFRLNIDGSIDTSFITSGTSSAILAITLQPDGKILIGGTFNTVNGNLQKCIARLNSDGSSDTVFNNNAPAITTVLTGEDGIHAIGLQPDNKIIIGGRCSIEGKSNARLNADGSLDTTFVFQQSWASGGVNSFAFQPDGKIIVGGDFQFYVNGGGSTYYRDIARLNYDGSLDTTFFVNAMEYNLKGVYDLTYLQSSGKIIIAGNFESVVNFNQPQYNIAMLNEDGTLDSTFIGNDEFPYCSIRAIALQGDGKIIIGGGFDAYQNVPRHNIARLLYSTCSAGFTLYPDINLEHNWFAINTCIGTSPIDYTWDWGDGSSSTGAYPSHIYDTAGYYNICVTITDGDDCSDTYCDNSTYVFKTGAEMVTVNVVAELPSSNGINEAENKLIKVYPNPTSGILTLEGLTAQGIYQLRDLTGKLLLSGSVTATKFNLDISTLSKGIYLLSVFDGERVAHRKIVKE